MHPGHKTAAAGEPLSALYFSPHLLYTPNSPFATSLTVLKLLASRHHHPSSPGQQSQSVIVCGCATTLYIIIYNMCGVHHGELVVDRRRVVVFGTDKPISGGSSTCRDFINTFCINLHIIRIRINFPVFHSTSSLHHRLF